jgi:uncharacterized protein (TIGR02145 family)
MYKFPASNKLKTNKSVMLIRNQLIQIMPRNLIRISVFIIFSLSLYSCLPSVELTGEIKGKVTDCETNEPVAGAFINVMRSYVPYYIDSTGIDGNFIIKNITPEEYVVQVSKLTYTPGSENVKVVSATTEEVNFCLQGKPIAGLSDTVLNFGLDLTSLPFVVSNSGRGKLTYAISSSQNWITVNPSSGELTEESDTIRVTINKTGLSDTIAYKEIIKVISDSGTDTVYVILNGFMYCGQVYKIVKIGTQTWMAENLNVGKYLSFYSWTVGTLTNGIIDKMCYNDDAINCDIWGGSYDWLEVMELHRSDTGAIGTVQGICPAGWHIPTQKEWLSLIDYLGGPLVAGGKLKEAGTGFWTSPNKGATNESGFTALPGGYTQENYLQYSLCNWSFGIDSIATFWTATLTKDVIRDINGLYWGSYLKLSYNNSHADIVYDPAGNPTYSVRCVKNP